ncbi:MAG: sodium:solute symporter family protein [Deltaproteobacteria bacterium]|nr:sodium:solute symporter family protein [Deltaproteobacteria bacterium]
MHAIDYAVITLYLAGVIGVGVYFGRRQTRTDEYFVGDRRMGAGHLGLSVVATDVGGGFSIGLGGLGFLMGISGSWLLFTGLVGAWISAVVMVPRVKALGDLNGWTTFPEFLEHRFDGRVRLVAAVLSGLGYAAFVGAQILAGATLASAAFHVDFQVALWVMAAVVVIYTALGGLQAVVYTDTVQWVILLAGLLGVALPLAWIEVGGLEGLRQAVPETHVSFTNLDALETVGWFVTILPIWFVGMTLYQRIYAARDVRTAKRAWYLAGLLEYPLMAFAGAGLGLMARALYPEIPAEQAETALPTLLRNVMPVGAAGLVIAAYFSAIMSTADSCLLASTGNVVEDLYKRHVRPDAPDRRILGLSRWLTLAIGLASVSVAVLVPRVLDAVLLSYTFMVSGLFVPTLAALFWKRATPNGALAAALAGGIVGVGLELFPAADPVGQPLLLAFPASLAALVAVSFWRRQQDNQGQPSRGRDRI